MRRGVPMRQSYFCFLAGLLVVSRAALGQVATSTALVGTVTDSTGAVVSDAAVVAIQDSTKVAYKGLTNRTGNYTLPYVNVGSYTISVEAPSFQKAVRKNVVVENNQTVR